MFFTFIQTNKISFLNNNVLTLRNNIVPFFLELFPGASAAYSLRKLHPDAIFAIRVRRSSDNQEMDIGFTSTGELDESALLLFVGSGDGFVVIWYDQSGNNNHASQSVASAQPKIVDVGVVIKENGKPAIGFDGSYAFINHSNSGNWQSVFIVFNYTKSTTDFPTYSGLITTKENAGGSSIGIIGSHRNSYFYRESWYENNIYLNNSPITIGSEGTSVIPEINSISLLSGFSTSAINRSNLQFGRDRDFSDRLWEGIISEAIFYPSDQSANRSNIETNINNHYLIY